MREIELKYVDVTCSTIITKKKKKRKWKSKGVAFKNVRISYKLPLWYDLLSNYEEP